MKKFVLTLLMTVLYFGTASAQAVDTTGIYGERKDTLEAVVFTGENRGNYISERQAIRTEIISSAGLMKMACCNLAESFENSASVTVGYSDATTGARQIRLLGLSGAYTQMLDENRPVMRAIAAPFGLSYIPGSWLESIQVAKGAPSVINGTEGITGTINLEHRKPTDGKPLFINGSVMHDTKTDLNVISSLDVGEKFHTVILGHFDGNFKAFDMNRDGFADDPRTLQFNLANRWLYYTPELQVRWGINGIRDRRRGGQLDGPWTSNITNTLAGGYLKVGKPLREDGSASIALVADYAFGRMDSAFGERTYKATQHSAFVNLIYRNQFSPSHDLTVGINGSYDHIGEQTGGWVDDFVISQPARVAPYAEYTFKVKEKFTLIAGVSGDVFLGKDGGFRPSPRATLRWQPVHGFTLRANGGRGLRRTHPLPDNIGVLSTGKALEGDLFARQMEDAWTYGGNLTFTFPLGGSISLDFFRTRFTAQALLDREQEGRIIFYTLDGHRSFSNNFQADFSLEPVRGLTLTLTGRYTDARAWQPTTDQVREIPLSGRVKGVLNVQYKPGPGKWVFDFTASVNGSARVPDFMRSLQDADGSLLYPRGRTPVYPLLFAQVTRRFRGFDIYLGGENLTNFRQKMPVIGYADPSAADFDASAVWGPVMGIKIYAGFRITLWK